MADDLAFLFNDPSSGSSPQARRVTSLPTRPVPHEARELPDDIDWMTLREAHKETSIPISTLRKWAKKGKVRARLVRTGGKDLRLVALGDVVGRAQSLERPIEPVVDLRERVDVAGVGTRPPSVTDFDGHIAPVATVESASRAPEPAAGGEGPVPGEPAPEEERERAREGTVVPEGSILVPLGAWDQMLGQLGNLHEAGQQLAEARERAAKAETEAEFLKERVREMRKRVEEAELALDFQSDSRMLPEAPEDDESVLRIGWRRFRDRWLRR